MLVVFVVIFYFLLIRPQMRRNKEMRNLLNSISNGDEVVTSGGMLGRVEKVGDTYVELAIADNVIVKLQKQAIASVVPKGTIKNV
jgi:preprotein translocase subunit YajC